MTINAHELLWAVINLVVGIGIYIIFPICLIYWLIKLNKRVEALENHILKSAGEKKEL